MEPLPDGGDDGPGPGGVHAVEDVAEEVGGGRADVVTGDERQVVLVGGGAAHGGDLGGGRCLGRGCFFYIGIALCLRKFQVVQFTSGYA